MASRRAERFLVFLVALVACVGSGVHAQNPAANPAITCGSITEAAGCVYAECWWVEGSGCQSPGCATQPESSCSSWGPGGICFWDSYLGICGQGADSAGACAGESNFNGCMGDNVNPATQRLYSGCQWAYNYDSGSGTYSGGACLNGGCASLTEGACPLNNGCVYDFTHAECRQAVVTGGGSTLTYTACSSHTDEWSCYADPACHYNGVSCQEGAPATCNDYYRDATGCPRSALGCAIDGTGHCMPTASPTFTSCSDAANNFSACLQATTVISGGCHFDLIPSSPVCNPVDCSQMTISDCYTNNQACNVVMDSSGNNPVGCVQTNPCTGADANTCGTWDGICYRDFASNPVQCVPGLPPSGQPASCVILDQTTCNTYPSFCHWDYTNSGCLEGAPSLCPNYNEAGCYSALSTCHWDIVNNLCADGAPAQCEDYYRDQTDCTAAGGACAVNTWNNQCFTLPSASPYSTTCNAQTTSSDCTTANCYWDLYAPEAGGAGRCYASLAEEEERFPLCGTWSNYPSGDAASACTNAKGCGLYPGNLCVDASSLPSSGSTGVSLDYNVTLLSIQVTDTLDVQVTFRVPEYQFFNPASPMWFTFGYGQGPSGDSPLTPNQCNNLAGSQPAFGIGEPRVDPPYANTPQLYQLFESSTNFDFSPYTSDQQGALTDVVGPIIQGPGGIFVSSVVANGNVDVSFTMPLSTASSACGTNCTQISESQMECDIAVFAKMRQGDNMASFNPVVPRLIDTWGSASIGATNPNLYRLSVDSRFENGDPVTDPPGSKRRAFTAYLTYKSSDPTQVIGLRSLDDVSMYATGGQGAQPVGSPTNCFGTHPVSVVPPSGPAMRCAGTTGPYCWTTRIEFKSRGVVPRDDGDSLNLCVYQLEASRALEMGGSDGSPPYDDALNNQEGFYQFPKQWPLASGPQGTFTYAGTDPTGATGDYLPISMNDHVYPNLAEIRVQLRMPTCGLFPLPDSSVDLVVVPAHNISNTLVDLSNEAMSSNYLLCMGCYYEDELLRQSYELHIQDQVVFYPLDAYGNPVLDAQGNPANSLTFDKVLPYLARTTRAHKGAHLGAAKLDTGVDGFCISPLVLRELLPAQGVSAVLPHYVALPSVYFHSVDNSATGSTNRRLLEFAGEPQKKASISTPQGIHASAHGRALLQATDPVAITTITVTNNSNALIQNTITLDILLPSSSLAVYYQTTQSSSSHLGAILGGVLGSFVLLFGFGWLLWVALNRENEAEKTRKQEGLISGKENGHSSSSSMHLNAKGGRRSGRSRSVSVSRSASTTRGSIRPATRSSDEESE